MSYRLHPAVSSDLGLEPALESYLHGLRRYTGLEIAFRMIGFEQRLDPEIESAPVSDISRDYHKRAKALRGGTFQALHHQRPNIIFRGEDDGVGFDMSKSFRQGLALWHERTNCHECTFAARQWEGERRSVSKYP